MKTRHFLTQLENDAIVKAIGQAEGKTSGEIRVFVSHKQPVDAVKAAEEAFAHLRMQQTKERNGVLIFVAPRVRKFAIFGDTNVHARCGDDFWQQVAGEMSGHFRAGKFTDGLLHGIARAGKLLAEHFPRHGDDTNQLPNEIVED